jgi:hypothetical protein
LHPGYANPQTSSSPTMSAGGGSSSSLGPH